MEAFKQEFDFRKEQKNIQRLMGGFKLPLCCSGVLFEHKRLTETDSLISLSTTLKEKTPIFSMRSAFAFATEQSFIVYSQWPALK